MQSNKKNTCINLRELCVNSLRSLRLSEIKIQPQRTPSEIFLKDTKEWNMDENQLSKIIIGAAIKVHKNLGPGLLESAYEETLYYELKKESLNVEKQKPMPLVYDEVKLDVGYRIDLMIESKVIIEIKSVEYLNDVHLAQVLTYLKLSGCRLGLLINFNVKYLKDGIKRVVNKL